MLKICIYVSDFEKQKKSLFDTICSIHNTRKLNELKLSIYIGIKDDISDFDINLIYSYPKHVLTSQLLKGMSTSTFSNFVKTVSLKHSIESQMLVLFPGDIIQFTNEFIEFVNCNIINEKYIKLIEDDKFYKFYGLIDKSDTVCYISDSKVIVDFVQNNFSNLEDNINTFNTCLNDYIENYYIENTESCTLVEKEFTKQTLVKDVCNLWGFNSLEPYFTVITLEDMDYLFEDDLLEIIEENYTSNYEYQEKIMLMKVFYRKLLDKKIIK